MCETLEKLVEKASTILKKDPWRHPEMLSVLICYHMQQGVSVEEAAQLASISLPDPELVKDTKPVEVVGQAAKPVYEPLTASNFRDRYAHKLGMLADEKLTALVGRCILEGNRVPTMEELEEIIYDDLNECLEDDPALWTFPAGAPPTTPGTMEPHPWDVVLGPLGPSDQSDGFVDLTKPDPYETT